MDLVDVVEVVEVVEMLVVEVAGVVPPVRGGQSMHSLGGGSQ